MDIIKIIDVLGDKKSKKIGTVKMSESWISKYQEECEKDPRKAEIAVKTGVFEQETLTLIDRNGDGSVIAKNSKHSETLNSTYFSRNNWNQDFDVLKAKIKKEYPEDVIITYLVGDSEENKSEKRKLLEYFTENNNLQFDDEHKNWYIGQICWADITNEAGYDVYLYMFENNNMLQFVVKWHTTCPINLHINEINESITITIPASLNDRYLNIMKVIEELQRDCTYPETILDTDGITYQTIGVAFKHRLNGLYYGDSNLKPSIELLNKSIESYVSRLITKHCISISLDKID